MNTERKHWGHNLTLSSHNGTTKGYCSCGAQYKPIPTTETRTIIEAHVQHTGLVERRPKSI